MAERFWVGGSGTWDATSTTHWSATNNGANGASAPGPNDVAYISDDVTVTLGSDIHVDRLYIYGSSANVILNAGTYNVTIDYVLGGGGLSGAGTINMGSGNWVIGSESKGQAGIFDFTGKTVNADTSSLTMIVPLEYEGFIQVDQDLYDVTIELSAEYLPTSERHFSFSGASTTFNSLTIQSLSNLDHVVVFEAGETYTFTNGLDVNGDAGGYGGRRVSLRSSTTGVPYTFSKSSGTITLQYVDLKDSTATGGATWQANIGSNDSGNNTGWTFLGDIYPSSIASLEAFESPSVNIPPYDITVPGIASAEAFGTFRTGMFASDFGAIDSAEAVSEPTIEQLAPPPAPPTDWTAIGKEDEKVYVYKVYRSDGTYLGIWTDVIDELKFTQHINTPGTTTTVRLGRSPNETTEVRSSLVTEDGIDIITTEDGHEITSVYQTPNSVGEDTDVDINHNVEVFVHYGEFEVLGTESDEEITTEDGEEIIVASGAPLGTRVFSGFILDYESTYGAQAGVTVTLASNGYELSHEVIKSGSATTVTYTSQTLEAMAKSILDTNPGVMSYDAGSIAATGVTTTKKFVLNTKLEGIQSVFDETPDDWYWYGNVADNNIYIQAKSAGYDHVFIIGYHVKSLSVKRSIEGLKNTVYFVGGLTNPSDPASTLFKKYEDATSVSDWRQGLDRITDRRYTVAANAERKANKKISRYKDPIFTTPLVISSSRYDLESISLGQTVGFVNAGNFIDDLPPVQIVTLGYAPTAATLQLGEVLDRQVDSVNEVISDLQNEQYDTVPDTPS